MTLLAAIVAGILPLCFAAYVAGRRKAEKVVAHGVKMHSQPKQYGWFAVMTMAIPGFAVAIAGALASLLGWFQTPWPMLVVACLVVGAGGVVTGIRLIQPELRARNLLESVVRRTLLVAALVSIATTIAIVLSLVFEAVRFFGMVGFWDFITGTKWSPDQAFLEGAGRGGEDVSFAFGSVPLFAGTFMVTLIAIGTALPVGLFAAIYMSEYASRRIRGVAKPMLEILAGIPTVVYGFFAAITFNPFIVDVTNFFGLEASYENMLGPGIVMGIMIVPFISSLSDDVLSSIPHSLREGAYALGTTRSECVKQVLLPAAMPGIVSATLLGISRALGETMIVVMAAGLLPNLTANPLETMTAVTVHIVANLTGDQAFDSALTLSAFGLGIVLFVVTLALNIISAVMVRRFKQAYD
jgi:phosphate transport system permease protein